MLNPNQAFEEITALDQIQPPGALIVHFSDRLAWLQSLVATDHHFVSRRNGAPHLDALTLPHSQR